MSSFRSMIGPSCFLDFLSFLMSLSIFSFSFLPMIYPEYGHLRMSSLIESDDSDSSPTPSCPFFKLVLSFLSYCTDCKVPRDMELRDSCIFVILSVSVFLTSLSSLTISIFTYSRSSLISLLPIDLTCLSSSADSQKCWTPSLKLEDLVALILRFKAFFLTSSWVCSFFNF